jgi:protein gp37
MFIDEKILRWPLYWRRPRKIFVDSQTDLFADFQANEIIDQIHGIMALAPQHTFQILTKRPHRMATYYGAPDVRDRILRSMVAIARREGIETVPHLENWPLRNVWLGVSAEDQQRADERIPVLLDVPAVIHFVSYEPALEELDLRPWLNGESRIDWVIIGGESGPGARPFDLEWGAWLITQCRSSGVSPFFKQAGSCPKYCVRAVQLRDRTGGDLNELPEYLRVREFPRLRVAAGGAL